MPWTENDYPPSLKNLPKVTRKKAIDIANAMVDEGYDEGRAIPIATKQAEEWHERASKQDIEDYEKHGDPKKRSKKDKKYPSHPERLEEVEEVVAHEDGWAVKSSGAERVTEVFKTKEKAIQRAKEIGKNKGTGLTVYDKDGEVQDKYSYDSKS